MDSTIEHLIPARRRDLGGFEGMRERGGRLHGLQAWVALPVEYGDTDPAFEHSCTRTRSRT
jgi:redox-sensitive bicupin YhaK (pirin superfamily)